MAKGDLPEALKRITPAYPHLVHYPTAEEFARHFVPEDLRHPDDIWSDTHSEGPPRMRSVEEANAWARVLMDAARSS